eukprot:SAG22_NODE_38_length_26325_cov_107.302067_27_plen_51_part_00
MNQLEKKAGIQVNFRVITTDHLLTLPPSPFPLHAAHCMRREGHSKLLTDS